MKRKNKFVTEIKIKNRYWKIVFDDPNNYKNTDIDFSDDDAGATLGTGEIYINYNISKEQVLAKLKHELVHAYVWSYGFYYSKWDEENMAAFIEIYGSDIVNDAHDVYDIYMHALNKEDL